MVFQLRTYNVTVLLCERYYDLFCYDHFSSYTFHPFIVFMIYIIIYNIYLST